MARFPEGSPRIVLSYRRDDAPGHAGRLFDLLVRHYGADRVFMDIDTIQPGQNWMDKIQAAIAAADVLLVVVGAKWFSLSAGGQSRLADPNDVVRRELEIARTEGLAIVPVLVDGAVLPEQGDLPEELRWFLELQSRALYDDRFNSDFRRLTEGFGGQPDTTANEVAELPEAPPSRPWNRSSIGVAVFAAVMTVLFVWALRRPESPKPVVRYTLVLPEEAPLQPVIGTSLTLSPDGSRLVYVGPGDQGTQLWLRERDQLVARPLPGTEAAWQPFFAPDGERVGFLTADRKLKVVSFTGEPPLTLLESARLQRSGGTWGPDGYVYITLGPVPWRLHRVPTIGDGDPEPVPLLDTTLGLGFPPLPLVQDALPNGKGVLFTDWVGSMLSSEFDSVAVVDLATGEHRVLVQGGFARYAAGHLVYLQYDGALLAAPFDQDKLVFTGPPVALLAGITTETAPDLALSETGRLVYVAGSTVAGSEVVWVDRDGTAEPIDPSWRGNFLAVALSPDETRLAVSIGTYRVTEQLWIKQLPRGPLSLLTVQGNINRVPAWTRDGRSVTFVSDRGENRDLYVKRADGSAGAEVLLDDTRAVAEGFHSPDGEWLVYSLEQTTEDHDIFAIRRGIDSVTTPLVATGFDEIDPALSPDGRWLAYSSNESGQPEVYVRPFPNAGDARWPVSTNGGIAPVWAHSGRELFYAAHDYPGTAVGSGSMISAEVLPGTTFRLGERRVLFSIGAYQDPYYGRYVVTPDDQRFVMIRLGDSGDASELIVVENFLEGLKAKVGNE